MAAVGMWDHRRMSRAAITIWAFGLYLIGQGLALAACPSLVQRLLGLGPAQDFWMRIAGVALFNIGIYYLCAAYSEARLVFYGSVGTRSFALVFMVGLAWAGLMPPLLLAAGLVEFAGAVWTLQALRTAAWPIHRPRLDP